MGPVMQPTVVMRGLRAFVGGLRLPPGRSDSVISFIANYGVRAREVRVVVWARIRVRVRVVRTARMARRGGTARRRRNCLVVLQTDREVADHDEVVRDKM